jgi:vancomycin permeability regulator SanA
LELYRAGRLRNVICSGGVGPNGVPEGDAMRVDLVANGVDPAIIVVDNAGKDSYCTAMNAKRLFAERNWRTALIVSNFTHISRCKLAFRRAGLSEVRSAHADFAWRDFKAFPHEFAGYYYYLVRSY